MLDHPSQASQSMSIHVGFCAHGGGQVHLYAGHACLSFSPAEFLRLAQVVGDTARALHARGLAQEPQSKASPPQECSSPPLLRPGDSATQLASVLCRLQTETEPACVEELRRLVVALDEEVRQEVRQYARERAAHARKDEG
jgi:hypothetical protein